MTSPAWENNQLAPYLREFNLVPATTRGSLVPPSPWWAQYPIMTSAQNNYAALSTGPNTNNQQTADTTGGDRVFDAGFGGIAN